MLTCDRFTLQGYEMSEEELKIDLQDFANKFSGPNGFPRYAFSSYENLMNLI